MVIRILMMVMMILMIVPMIKMKIINVKSASTFLLNFCALPARMAPGNIYDVNHAKYSSNNWLLLVVLMLIVLVVVVVMIMVMQILRITP